MTTARETEPERALFLFVLHFRSEKDNSQKNSRIETNGVQFS